MPTRPHQPPVLPYSFPLAEGGHFRVGRDRDRLVMSTGNGPRATMVNLDPREAIQAAHGLLVAAALVMGHAADEMPTLEELRAEASHIAERAEKEREEAAKGMARPAEAANQPE